MRKTTWGLLGLGALLGLALTLAAGAQGLGQKQPPTLKQSIAAASKEKEATVEKVLKAFGPAVREQLASGQEVAIEGVGTLRVVRVAAYKDLINGIPGIVPAKNYVEFVPAEALTAAANAPGAVPAKTVEPYEFRVNPNSEPGLRAEPRKVPRSRAGR